MTRPYRSALYIPASKPRAMEKAQALPCDAIIFDLEDAVAPAAKPAARAALAQALGGFAYGGRARLLRVNALSGPWGAEDLAAVAAMPCEGVLLPKVDSPQDIHAAARLMPHPVWAMIETPAGVLNAAAICAHPRLAGIVVGTNDLLKDLGGRAGGGRAGAGRAPLHYALGAVLLAARAAGKVALDGVYNAFKDTEGLAREAEEGRDFGYDGKTVIHPDQIATVNAVFGPSAADLDLAARQIAAYDAALAEGQAVAVVDGRIVEGLHVVTARALLAKAAAIAEIEGA